MAPYMARKDEVAAYLAKQEALFHSACRAAEAAAVTVREKYRRADRNPDMLKGELLAACSDDETRQQFQDAIYNFIRMDDQCGWDILRIHLPINRDFNLIV